MQALNSYYENFIDMPNGLSAFVNSLVVNKLLKSNTNGFENVRHKHFDFSSDSLVVILTKPFIERLIAFG